MKITIETDTECIVIETFYKEKGEIKEQIPILKVESSINYEKTKDVILDQSCVEKSGSINYEKAKDVILGQSSEFMFLDIRKILKDIPEGSIGNALRFLYKQGRIQKVGVIRGRVMWKVAPAWKDKKNYCDFKILMPWIVIWIPPQVKRYNRNWSAI